MRSPFTSFLPFALFPSFHRTAVSAVLLLLLLAALGPRIAGAADAPKYYVGPQHYAYSPYQAVTEGRTMTKVQRERVWTGTSYEYTGNMQRLRTTGTFSAPDIEVATTNTVPLPFGYNRILNQDYGKIRTPDTPNGDTLLYLGTFTSGGSPGVTGGVIWKADDTVVQLAPILGAPLLIPRDMNDGLQVVGYLTTDFTSEGETRPINLPVLGSGSGGVGVVPPGQGVGYGFAYGMTTNGTQMVTNNGAKAVAINNQGVLVCDAHFMKKDDHGYYFYRTYSFTSKNGAVLKKDLPGGATDINDLGEVVGYNGADGTWLYLPVPNYGLAAGLHIIDRDTYDPDAFQSFRPMINARGDVTWTGFDTTLVGAQDLPPRLWHAGQIYTLTNLYVTTEQFTLKDVIDMNSKGDLLVSMLFDKEFSSGTFEVYGNRILSLTPFQEEITVNVTGDESDATDTDDVVDVDLDMEGQQVTLRAALDAVIAGRASKVKFDIPGPGIPIIQLTKILPEVNTKVEIDGTTQEAGMVEVRGRGTLPFGLKLTGGNSIVRGLDIHSFTNKGAACIELAGGGTNLIAGNFIGVDASGTIDNGETGIRISGSATNLIGGTTPEDRNIIYGKFRAIHIVGEGADDNAILGNRLGLGATGGRLGGEVGVEIRRGNRNRVGSSAPGGGNYFGSANGVSLNPEVSIEGVTIEGNRIGLDLAGTSAGKPGFGIVLQGDGSIQTRDARIINNLIAGGLIDIWIFGSVGTEVSGNTVGLRFDGTVEVPSSTSGSSNFWYGIRTDLADHAVITNNVVAGHLWDIALCGAANVEVHQGDPDDPTDDTIRVYDPLELGAPPEDEPVLGHHRVENNVVGIKDGQKPAGIDSRGGISVFGGAPSIRLSGNTVAGHGLYEIGVLNGSDHELYANKVGTDSGANYLSAIGVLVSEPSNVAIGKTGSGNVVGLCAISGIAVVGANTNVTIAGNQVGVTGSSTLRGNYNGIRIAKDDQGEKPSNVRILENRIGGNAVGISLEGTDPVLIEDNIVGLHLNGTAATNVTGIAIADTIATLKNNTIASNALYGVEVESPATGYPVLIEGGSIFGNGPGEDFGIYYHSAQVAPPSRFYASKTVAPDGSGSYIFAAPPSGGSGSATFEVYGNPPGAVPQGRFSIVRQTVPATHGLAVRVPFTASSLVAGLEGFRATVTLGDATSAFSPAAEGEILQPPPLDFSSDSQPDIVSLTWSTGDQDIFRVVRSTSLDGPWDPVDAEPVSEGSRKTVSIPAGTEAAVYFRLELDPAHLFR